MDHITIRTDPFDGMPTIELQHHAYGTREINAEDVSVRDYDDIRLLAEIELDLLDGELSSIPVVDRRLP